MNNLLSSYVQWALSPNAPKSPEIIIKFLSSEFKIQFNESFFRSSSNIASEFGEISPFESRSQNN